jgi:deoxycytidylate deaminase
MSELDAIPMDPICPRCEGKHGVEESGDGYEWDCAACGQHLICAIGPDGGEMYPWDHEDDEDEPIDQDRDPAPKEPPDYVIEAARVAAMQSPCAKSKRGVVLFNPARHDEAELHGQLNDHARKWIVVSSGFNGPPAPFVCRDRMVCRSACRDVCLHAEQRAIIAALGCDDAVDLELVHVKVVDGAVVPGGGPSCLQCSKLVVEARLRGVWLLEAQRWHDEIPCGTCNAKTIVAQDDGTDCVCAPCSAAHRYPGVLEFRRAKTIYAADSGVWRFYSANAFHEATLASNGIASLGATP